MAKVSLVLATIVDLGIALLLIAVSGFILGAGPQSLRGGGAVGVIYVAAIVACMAAPIIGFLLNGKGRAAPAQFVAWLPVVGAFVALVAPAPY